MRTRIVLTSTLLLSFAVWGTGCKSTSSAPASSDTSSSQTSPNSPASPGAAPSSASPSSAPTSSPNSPASSAPEPAPMEATAPPPAVEPTPPPPPPPVVIPAGTTLRVRLVQPVGSKISDPGQSFDATFSSPVVVNGNTVVPVGTRAVGTVTEAHASGRFKGGATLNLRLNSFRLNGSTFAISTATYAQTSTGKGKRTAAMVGGGTGGGALIGGIAGGGKGALIGGLIGAGAGTVGAATTNRDITLPSETIIHFRLNSSVRLGNTQ
jgi:hypothetical protein